MANDLQWQNFKSIKWIVQAPSAPGSRLNSKSFLLKGLRCYLTFYNGHPGIINHGISPPHLCIHKDRNFLSDIEVEVSVCSNNVPLSYVRTILSCKYINHVLWRSTKVRMLTSSYLIFRINFLADYTKVDKSIQTVSYMNASLSLSEDFSKLLETEVNPDVEVKCRGDSFNLHKTVLSARSEVFKAMLQSNMLEGLTGVVVIEDIDACVFQDFIKYLYIDAMPKLTFEKAKALYEAGDKYAVKSLVFQCAEYLQDNISLENAFECYALADAHSDQNLMDVIKSYLLEKKVYRREDYWLPFIERFPNVALEIYQLSYRKKRKLM